MNISHVAGREGLLNSHLPFTNANQQHQSDVSKE